MAFNNGRDNNQGQGSQQLSRKEVVGPDVPGLKLWNQVCETDPAWTKSFTRKGGFKGTAIHHMYNIRKASEVFEGPCGTTWGFTELETKIENGAPSVLGEQGQHLVYERIWFSKVSLWFYWTVDGKRVKCEGVPQWGATTMVQKGKNGWDSDEEAAKKSFTDACSKCLSLLGFGADIHMGMYDDNKYVNDLRTRFAEEAERQHGQGDGGGNGGGQQSGQSGNQTRGSSQSSNNGQRSQTQGASQQRSSTGGQQMSPALKDLLQQIDAGMLTNDAVPLIEQLAQTSKVESTIAAVALVKKRIALATDTKHLELLARRQKWLLDGGYINAQQNKELTDMGSAKWDELDPPQGSSQA